MIREENKSGDSSLRDWFTKSRASDGTPGWVQLGGKYAGKPCAKQPGQTTKPKCGSSKMKRNLDDEEEQRAFERKNRQDPNPDRKGKAKNVATEEKQELRYCPKCKKAEKRSDCAYGTKYWDNNAEPITVEEEAGEKDACYHKVKSRYKVWPSAYASGALVKCRRKGSKNWGTKSEGFTPAQIYALKENGFDVSEAVSFEVDSKSHRTAQRNAKIGNLARNTTNAGEKAAAEKKAKGPKLYGENITIEDANGNTFAEIIDVIKNPLVSESCCSKCGKEPCECGTKRPRGGSAAKPGPDKNYVKPMGEEFVDEAHWNLATRKVEPGNPNAAHKAAVVSAAAKASKGKKKRNETPRRGASKFTPSSPEQAKADKQAWNDYWNGSEEFVKEAVRIPAKTGNIVFVNLTWRGKYYGIKVFFPHTKVPSRKEVQTEIEKVYPGARVYNFQVSDYEPGQPLLQVSESIDKDKMKCNKPKAQAVGDSLTGKSHVVKACEGGKEKIIRFGQRGVKGSPKKEGESEGYASRRKAFKDRHAKNIAKGKMSAAYWANKVKW